MKQAIGAILLVVGTLAAVGYMAAHLFMQDPIPASILALVVVGYLLLEKR